MRLSELKVDKLKLFSVFSSIKLDIEGSNLANTGWMPCEEDRKYIPNESYEDAIKEYLLQNEKVLFKNISLQWDSCDCGDGYGCSHGDFVHEIHIYNDDKKHEISFEDADHLSFYANNKLVKFPTSDATVYDFIRACEICEINLEFTDYAIKLLQ